MQCKMCEQQNNIKNDPYFIMELETGYVILGCFQRFKGYTVFNCKEHGPGVRLYFDMRKVAEDGLLIRDGCHLKVKDTLPLSPYLIWAADWKSVGLSSRHSTPSEFTCKANSCFNKIYGKMIFESF